MSWETIIYKRDELYQAVWNEPVRQVAQRFAISDVALAKICHKLNVPLPGRGYWARKAAGQELKRNRLPPLKDGELAEHRVRRWRDDSGMEVPSTDVKEQVAREKEIEQRIVVPEQLLEPHRFILASLPLLKKSDGKLGSVLSERRCLHVLVSQSVLDRALRIFDALLKALEGRGFEIVLTEPHRPRPRDSYERTERSPSKTGVKIGEFFVRFTLWENEDVIKIPPPPPPKRTSKWNPPPSSFAPRPEFEHRPNGKLTLAILDFHHHGARLSWSDGKIQRLEDCLNEFVAGLIMAAERMRLARLEAQERERSCQEEKRRREEAEQRRQLEERLVYDLDSRLGDWFRAREIRHFVEAVEADAQASGRDVDPGSELGQWLTWARQRADTLESHAVRTVLNLRVPSPQRIRW